MTSTINMVTTSNKCNLKIDEPYLLTKYCLLLSPVYCHRVSIPANTQRRAINGPPGPLVARRCVLFWLVTFVYFSENIRFGCLKEPSRWEGPFMHPNLGFGCCPLIVKLWFKHSKEVFQWDGSFKHPKHMSVIFVYYRNCCFCHNLLAHLVCSLIVNSGQERHDQIKINFSCH